MIRRLNSSAGALIVASALLSPPAHALNADVQANVTHTLVQWDDTYGGCMIRLSVNPADSLAGCGANWLTLSCNGDFTDPVRAYRLLDQAQLALATGKEIHVWFTDDKRHNGYCQVRRIDLYQ